MIEKQADYCEFYNFATSQNNSNIIQFYLSNLDILWRHTFYFKDKGADLIQKAHNDRLILPRCTESNANNQTVINGNLTSSYLSETKIRRYYIFANGIDTFLTENEVKCCYQLIHGKSVKEIAKIVYLSARTVESHINNVKQKLNCLTKANLINIIRNQTTIAKSHF